MNPLDHIHSVSACDLCGADLVQHGVRVVAGSQEILGTSVPLSTVVCRRCRFIFQLERFSDDLLAALYEPDTSFAFGEAEEDRPKILAGLIERQAVVSVALASHDLAAGATVLDVGGGRGECCQHLVPQYRVVVADATDCAPVDPRIKKVPGLFSSSLGEGTFDVVVMNHILEHVFSPTDFLASSHRVLKDGGILIVEVPFELYTPLVARHLGDWRHVGYFCRATLRQFLVKSGFAVLRLIIEEGCYGVRRLPVIRAVAQKLGTTQVPRSIKNSPLALAADMLSPVVLLSLVKSKLVHR
jgi:SAM-dependent methyltransferase